MGSTGSRDFSGYYEKIDFRDNEPTLIIEPFLYLGGMYARKNPRIIEYLGITHVLNMAAELHLDTVYLTNRNVNVKHIPAEDHDGYNIKQHFEEAFQFIEEALSKNGRILVHCAVGISRSPTIVIAYIMFRYNMSFQAAYQYVQYLRPTINPNNLFKRQLQEFEYELMNVNRPQTMGQPMMGSSSGTALASNQNLTPQQIQQKAFLTNLWTLQQQMEYDNAVNKAAATSNFNMNGMNPSAIKVGSKRNYTHHPNLVNTDAQPPPMATAGIPMQTKINYTDPNYLYQNANNNFYAEPPYAAMQQNAKRNTQYVTNITRRKQERPKSIHNYNSDFDDNRSRRRSNKSTDSIGYINRRYSDNTNYNKSFETSRSSIKYLFKKTLKTFKAI